MDLDRVVTRVEQRMHAVIDAVSTSVKVRYLFGTTATSSELLIVLSSNEQAAHDTVMAAPRASMDVWVSELAEGGQDWTPKGLINELASLLSVATEAIHRAGGTPERDTTQHLRRILRDRELAPARNLLLLMAPLEREPGDKPCLGVAAALAASASVPFQ